MLISIIVPVYNVKDYLIRCLQSLAEQECEDYEVIVVDDGSTDGSGEMADAFCADKDAFRVFHKENGGLMSAWMFGLEQATGTYIGFVDSDDFVDTKMYGKMAERINRNGADIVMCNHYYDFRPAIDKLELHRNPIADGFYDGEVWREMKKLAIPQLHRDYLSPSRCTKLIKKELLLNNLKYCDPRVSSAEDVNSMVPCLLSCRSLYYVDQPFYYYCKRPTSISYVFREGILDTYQVLIQKLIQAATDWQTGLEENCRLLYNFYGITWGIYVCGSGMSRSEKNAQLRRLFDIPEYREMATRITPSDGRVAGVYQKMMLRRKPAIFCRGYGLITTVSRWLKR